MVKTKRGLVERTDDEIRAIRRAYKSGKNITEQMLAEQYNTSRVSIHNIVTGKSYKHVV